MMYSLNITLCNHISRNLSLHPYGTGFIIHELEELLLDGFIYSYLSLEW
jgi:hypothetical protein